MLFTTVGLNEAPARSVGTVATLSGKVCRVAAPAAPGPIDRAGVEDVGGRLACPPSAGVLVGVMGRLFCSVGIVCCRAG